MKQFPCLLLLVFVCATHLLPAQGLAILGTQFVEDKGNRLLNTSDGNYITAGFSGLRAVLVKTDCQGNILAVVEQAPIPGPAVFSDVVELADGSLIAVGSAVIVTPTDTASHVFLLKTTANLGVIATQNFLIAGKGSAAKSAVLSTSGELLLWGDVEGQGVDFTDAFFQTVNTTTLLPTSAAVLFNNGVDKASRITSSADGNYLVSGSSFLGNIFDPNALINHSLWVYKVAANGSTIWQANVLATYQAKQGIPSVAGVAQNPETGNIMLAGSLYGGTDIRKNDAFFALMDNNGMVLDTSYAAAAGQQQFFALLAQQDVPGLFSMVGESDGSPTGAPSIAFAQSYEFMNTIFVSNVSLDPATLIALRDLVEIDPGRVAFMGNLPDNPTSLSLTDVVIATPEATASIVFQNCALAATFSVPTSGFQWLYEGQVIAGANQGVFFPMQAGLYQVQIIDNKGCIGISDTFRVNGPTADFQVNTTVLNATFVNNSQSATSYLWNFGDGQTSTQANPTHTYAVTGIYNVVLIATGPCGLKDTLQQTVGVTPTAEPSWLGAFSLSPNPARAYFQVSMTGNTPELVSLTLVNTVGQIAEQQTHQFQQGHLQTTFSIAHLPDGVYWLQIQSGREIKNVRLVKG